MKRLLGITTFLLALTQCKPTITDLNGYLLANLLLLDNFLSPSTSCGERSNQSNGVVDPLFNLQWHLKNTNRWPNTNPTGVVGMDSNVESVWNSGIRGNGVHISVVDDGVDICHEDLQNNVDFSKDFNIDFSGALPVQVNGLVPCELGNVCHGTAVAGVAAAIGTNGIGGSGTAPLARLSGRNLLTAGVGNLFPNLVTSMTRNISRIDISNNSYGALDGTGMYDDSFGFFGWKMAVQEGVTLGRNNRGSLYFWSAGNGGNPFGGNVSNLISEFNNGDIQVDNSNYDGQANNTNVMAICSVGNDGKRAFYSERGANLLLCGYSVGNNNVGVTTTDTMGGVGFPLEEDSVVRSRFLNENYTNSFGGTSSATPNVAGVAALILEARPGLSWRELRWVLARSAREVDSTNAEWVSNGAGFRVNHNYGFGAVDASRAITEARNLTSFGSQILREGTGGPINIATKTGASFTFAPSDESVINVPTGIGKIESVEVTVMFNDNVNIGDLDIRIKAPGLGAESRLSEPHPCLQPIMNAEINQVPCNTGSVTWTFTTLRNMDESADGNWTLRVVDRRNAPILNVGSFNLSGNPVTIRNTANHNNVGAQVTSWILRIRGRAV